MFTFGPPPPPMIYSLFINDGLPLLQPILFHLWFTSPHRWFDSSLTHLWSGWHPVTDGLFTYHWWYTSPSLVVHLPTSDGWLTITDGSLTRQWWFTYSLLMVPLPITDGSLPYQWLLTFPSLMVHIPVTDGWSLHTYRHIFFIGAFSNLIYHIFRLHI
jgi:hypothetical protein